MAAIEDGEFPLTPQMIAEELYGTNDWGVKSGQTREQFILQVELVHKHHKKGKARNVDHGIDVVKELNELADEYETAHPLEPPLNRKVMNGVGFWHDSDDTEIDSAELFEIHAPVMGYSFSETFAVKRGIATTSEYIEPSTREEKIVEIADLFNLGNSDFGAVEARSLEFMEEARAEQGDQFDETSYRKQNLQRVASFLCKNLSLGGMELPWLNQAELNYRNMVNKFVSDRGDTVQKTLQQLGAAARKVYNRTEQNGKEEN